MMTSSNINYLLEKTKCKSVNYLQITNGPISKLAAMPCWKQQMALFPKMISCAKRQHEFHERYLTHENIISKWLLLNISNLWVSPKLKCILFYRVWVGLLHSYWVSYAAFLVQEGKNYILIYCYKYINNTREYLVFSLNGLKF